VRGGIRDGVKKAGNGKWLFNRPGFFFVSEEPTKTLKCCRGDRKVVTLRNCAVSKNGVLDLVREQKQGYKGKVKRERTSGKFTTKGPSIKRKGDSVHEGRKGKPRTDKGNRALFHGENRGSMGNQLLHVKRRGKNAGKEGGKKESICFVQSSASDDMRGRTIGRAGRQVDRQGRQTIIID